MSSDTHKWVVIIIMEIGTLCIIKGDHFVSTSYNHNKNINRLQKIDKNEYDYPVGFEFHKYSVSYKVSLNSNGLVYWCVTPKSKNVNTLSFYSLKNKWRCFKTRYTDITVCE